MTMWKSALAAAGALAALALAQPAHAACPDGYDPFVMSRRDVCALDTPRRFDSPEREKAGTRMLLWDLGDLKDWPHRVAGVDNVYVRAHVWRGGGRGTPLPDPYDGVGARKVGPFTWLSPHDLRLNGKTFGLHCRAHIAPALVKRGAQLCDLEGYLGPGLIVRADLTTLPGPQTTGGVGAPDEAGWPVVSDRMAETWPPHLRALEAMLARLVRYEGG